MKDTLIESFLESARTFPDKLCLGFHQERLTYAETRARVLGCAKRLQRKYDVRNGDFVMISAVSKPDYVIAYLATQYLGAVSIPIDKLIKPSTLFQLVQYVKPKILLSDTREKVRGTKKVSLKEIVEFTAEEQDIAYVAPKDFEAVCEMLFTTGTTGMPKGAMLAYRSVKHITLNTWNGVHMEPSDIVLIPLPLNHSVGMRVLRTALSIGASVVIQNGFTFAMELEVNIKAFGCTALVSVPASIEVIRRQMGDHFRRVLSSLRYIEFGAGSLSVPLKQAITEELPNTKLYNTWGSSETGGAIFLDITAYPDKLGSLGKPMPGIVFAVQRDDGSFDTNAHDFETSGRMALKGDMRMAGYFNMPEESKAAVQGEWLVTNDLAYQDADGFVYMLGRADDIINVGGEKVSPIEIETMASAYPQIRECAVLSAEDALLGQVPVLYYVLNGEGAFKVDDFFKFMQEKVEKYKIPQKFVQLDALPRNRMLKLDRKALKAMWKDNSDKKKFLGLEFKKFTEENYPDACKIIEQVFSRGAVRIIDLGLKNPAKDLVAEAGNGEVVYEDGEPVGFHAAFPRRMYYKQTPFVYISGSTIGVLKTAKTPFLAIQILKKTQMVPRAGSLLFVGNTINKNRMNLNKILRSKYKGPQQCAEKRLMRVGLIKFYRYMLETKILKRKSTTTWRGAATCIDAARMDDFWARYLKTNRGVTASRTSQELDWLFGERLEKGRAAIVELVENGMLAGYAVLASSVDGKRWRLMDAIVLENNLARLERLFLNVKAFLKTTPAVLCETTGYCDAAQGVIARAFPVKRRLANNEYFIHFQTNAAEQIPIERLNSLDSWLFGCYEGDAVML